jgi:hypothetical protein
MADVTVEGLVDYLEIKGGIGQGGIRPDGGGPVDNISLWFTPFEPITFLRLLQFSLLKQAAANGHKVFVAHPDTSSYVTRVKLILP